MERSFDLAKIPVVAIKNPVLTLDYIGTASHLRFEMLLCIEYYYHSRNSRYAPPEVHLLVVPRFALLLGRLGIWPAQEVLLIAGGFGLTSTVA